MGCTQSKSNEQAVEITVAPIEITVSPIEVSMSESEQVLVEFPVSVQTEEELAPTSTVKEKTLDSILEFVAGEVTVNEYGVAFYNFDGVNPADPTQNVHVCKRFSEFKDLHAEVSLLMVSEKNVKAKDLDKFKTFPALPAMPRANAATFVMGRGNRNVVKEREAQFVKILNAIARHPIAYQSQAFNDFLA